MTTRRAAGRKAHDQGARFELAVLHAWRLFAPPDVYLERTAPPTRIVRQGNSLRVVYEGSGTPDFHGCNLVGTLVVFDAKSTDEPRWPLRHLSAEQSAHLARASNRAIAGVLLRIDRRIYWLDWSVLGPVWTEWSTGHAARGAASVSADWAAENGTALPALDWWRITRE